MLVACVGSSVGVGTGTVGTGVVGTTVGTGVVGTGVVGTGVVGTGVGVGAERAETSWALACVASVVSGAMIARTEAATVMVIRDFMW